MVKTYALIVIPCFGVNCVATEVRLRFSCAASAAHFLLFILLTALYLQQDENEQVMCNFKVAKSTLKVIEQHTDSVYHRASTKRKDIL